MRRQLNKIIGHAKFYYRNTNKHNLRLDFECQNINWRKRREKRPATGRFAFVWSEPATLRLKYQLLATLAIITCGDYFAFGKARRFLTLLETHRQI